MKVLRAMSSGLDGSPEVAEAGKNPARTIGVRTGGRRFDIEVSAAGFVQPEKGGMSVSPPPPENLEEHRRPSKYGGTGKDPVWEMETDNMTADLAYRPDPGNPNLHGFIEPSRPMHLDNYLAALHSTRPLWRLY
jgi:hypothetical protein